MTVPHMQQRYTDYDFGQNTARNLLDAVRMKNQAEAENRKLGILEASEARMAADYKRNLATEKMVNKAMIGRLKDRGEQEELKKRINISGKGAKLPYRVAQWVEDQLPWTDSEMERKIKSSGGPWLPQHGLEVEDLEGFEGDVGRLYPFFYGRQNLMQGAMMNQNQPAYTQSQTWNPVTQQFE